MTGRRDDPAISIEDVSFAYGRQEALRGASLSVPEGSTTVLLGRNGAGKTTLLRVCAGLLVARSGRARVLGLDPTRERENVCARVAFVPDRPDAWGWMTAADLFRWLAAHHPRWDRARAAACLERLGVPAGRPLRSMSRGEATKTMLAAALGPDPDVLLLDEPFGGLDPLVHDEVLRAVIDAVGGRPRTILLSTHDLDVATRIGDRVAVLEAGRVLREFPVEGERPEDLRRALAEASTGAAS